MIVTKLNEIEILNKFKNKKLIKEFLIYWIQNELYNTITNNKNISKKLSYKIINELLNKNYFQNLNIKNISNSFFKNKFLKEIEILNTEQII